MFGPLSATILCIWVIWFPRIHVSRISLLAKKKITKKERKKAPILKLTNDQKPETLFGLTWWKYNSPDDYCGTGDVSGGLW